MRLIKESNRSSHVVRLLFLHNNYIILQILFQSKLQSIFYQKNESVTMVLTLFCFNDKHFVHDKTFGHDDFPWHSEYILVFASTKTERIIYVIFVFSMPRKNDDMIALKVCRRQLSFA